VSDTTLRTQATPTQNVWYNLGTLTISIPIGIWRVSYECSVEARHATGAWINHAVALSTANNSASDADFHVRVAADTVKIIADYFRREKILSLAAKTAYYLNERVENSGSSNLYLRSDVAKTFIRAECVYL
jgi:hypothetical protein